MGNSTNEGEEGRIQDARFGLIKVSINHELNETKLESGPTEVIMTLKSSELSVQEYEKWKKAIQFYQPARQILLLPLETKIVQKSWCGKCCIVEMKFPSYRILLRDEIRQRAKIMKFYIQPEIWNLLYHLVALGFQFEKISKKVGDIHPLNIAFNEQGFLKVIGEVSMPKEMNNFQKICESQLADVYLAPQQIDYDCFGMCKYPPGVDKASAELFSIGMTILEAGTLEYSTKLYDRVPYRINQTKLKANLQIFEAKYSAELYRILESLLAKKVSSRRPCKDLYQTLKPYEAQILNMEPFQWHPSDSLIYSSMHSQNGHIQQITHQNIPNKNPLIKAEQYANVRTLSSNNSNQLSRIQQKNSKKLILSHSRAIQ